MHRRALWIIGGIGLTGLFFFIVSLMMGLVEGPVDYFLVLMPMLVFLAGAAGVVLMVSGKPGQGAWVVLCANLLMSLVVGVFIFGMAPGIGSYAFVTSLLLIFNGIPDQQQRRAINATLVVVMVMAMVEFWNPGFRVTSPELIDMSNYFSTFLWVVFLVMIVGQVRSRSISVERRINAGFLIVIYLSVLISLMSVRTFRDYNTAADMLFEKTQKVQVTTELQSALWRLKEAESQIVLAPSAGLANEYDLRRLELENYGASWLSLMDGEAGAAGDLALHLQEDLKNLTDAANQSVAAAQAGQAEEARDLQTSLVNPQVAALADQIDGVLNRASDERMHAAVELDEVVQAALLRTMGVGIFTFLVGGVLSLVVMRSIVNPLAELQRMAQAIGSGDRTVRARPASDEIGSVAKTLDDTAEQLDQLYTNLEAQVKDRTHALEVSADVSRRLSTILNLDQLARAVVEQLREAFNFYHVHIYLFDESRRQLRMAAGSNEAGREMPLEERPIQPGEGLVGRVAQTNEMALVANTARDPNWLPNPLLPDTRSQVAVPISIGDSVLGVLDVQQDVADGISPEDARLIQSIANQVAIAIQNAQAYARAQSQARHEQLITDVAQKVQQATSVEEVLQVAVRELGQALGARRSSVELRSSALANPGKNEPAGL